MASADEYRRLAAECSLIAEDVTDPKNKNLLIHMAQTWLRLAQQKSLSSDSETHPPRTTEATAAGAAQLQQQQQQQQPQQQQQQQQFQPKEKG